MGDSFTCHVIHNPDQQSEIVLLKNYAPKLPVHLLVLAKKPLNRTEKKRLERT
jgi:hypothetical protein